VVADHYLNDARLQLRKLKEQADAALAQTSEADLFTVLDPEANSIALIMKHMVGNMRSRWTNFLTEDGEKPTRDRDREFEREMSDSAASIRQAWEEGWTVLFDAIAALTPDDLERTIRIRGEAHTVLEAINRQVTHYAGHVGQIVLLAKHAAGPRWRSLSIPRGQSRRFDVSKRGGTYRVERSDVEL
jgi:hypothetical protein